MSSQIFQSLDLSQLNLHALRGQRYVTAIDIGATNTRVQFVIYGSASPTIHLPKLSISDTGDLVAFMHALGDHIADLQIGPAAGAALAIAGPVKRGSLVVRITNYHGAKDLDASRLPENLFPPGSTRLLNDLEAACHGVVYLSAQGILDKYFDCLSAAAATTAASSASLPPSYGAATSAAPPSLGKGNVIVLAAGTGLGAGLLIGGSLVVPGEGGHMLIPRGGGNAGEGSGLNPLQGLFDFAAKELYDGKQQQQELGIEYEDICSGRGLVLSHRYYGGDASLSDAGTIAKAEDQPSKDAMLAFYRVLMMCAQSMSICVMAETVVLLGDNQVANNATVETLAKGPMMETFLHHPKRNWLESMLVLKQVHSINLNLEGCVHVAMSLDRNGR